MLATTFARKSSLPRAKNAVSILYDVNIYNRPLISPLRCIATSVPIQKEQSFVVSYLVNSLGFSEEAALKLKSSRYLHFETPEKPDSVLEFFKNYGFSETQVFRIVSRCPQLLLSNPSNTILPKFEFLCSKVPGNHDLVKLISSNPNLLERSLENCIIPRYHFFKSILGSDENVLIAFKSSTWSWNANSQLCAEANIAILRGHGVHQSNIIYMLSRYPKSLMSNVDKFRTIVEEVNALGINPVKLQFVIAVCAKCSMNASTWKSKLNVYSKWGWSDREIMSAFTKLPSIMMYSEEKINATMNYLIKKMGWETSFVTEYPLIIACSLENRIIPRGAVFNALLSKGLIEKNISLYSLFIPTEMEFLRRFVTDHKKEAPHLLNLYQKNLALVK